MSQEEQPGEEEPPLRADFWESEGESIFTGDVQSDVTAPDRSEMRVKTWSLGALLWWGGRRGRWRGCLVGVTS